MFVVFLRLAENRAAAPQHMEGHKAWIRQGFDAVVFLLTGSLGDQQGGMVLAHGVTREALGTRVGLDPFVIHGVVVPVIVEVTPSMTNAQLQFLMPEA